MNHVKIITNHRCVKKHHKKSPKRYTSRLEQVFNTLNGSAVCYTTKMMLPIFSKRISIPR